jgi:O-antigen biosynthesis protein
MSMKSSAAAEPIARSLGELYAEHGGKLSHKWTSYLAEYDRLFGPYRDRPISMLEIGVQNGGSLELWSRYFPLATQIIGCDINPKCGQLKFDDPRISVIAQDACSESGVSAVRALCGGFDLVIDDGSHTSSDIVRGFAKYFPLVPDGGIYVCEDLHAGYWKEFQGGLLDPHSAITFFKLLIDVVNHEHWRVAGARRDLMRHFTVRYGAEFDEAELARVHSVEFINSLCVVRKEPAPVNSVGLQVVVGSESQVDARPRAMHNLPAMFPQPSGS